MKTQTAEEIFENNFDCYADTWKIEQGNYPVEGEVIMAMTKDKFVELFNQHTTTQIEALRERLKQPIELQNGVVSFLDENSIDQTINNFLKEINP
jgi:hypothetical protein